MNSAYGHNHEHGSHEPLLGPVATHPDAPVEAGPRAGAPTSTSSQRARQPGHQDEHGQEQAQELRALQAQLHFLRKREAMLSKLLFAARDQLQQARGELAALRAGKPLPAGVNGAARAAAAVRGPEQGEVAYPHLVQRIRDIVATIIPPDAVVAVVSRGDDSLLELGSRHGWHFPQTQDGVYAGFYPAESKAAIGHLELLRTKGASYLLFPKTALWWLDYYQEFNRYLNSRFQRIWEDDSCLIFQLEAL